jgi:hypothetical protein
MAYRTGSSYRSTPSVPATKPPFPITKEALPHFEKASVFLKGPFRNAEEYSDQKTGRLHEPSTERDIVGYMLLDIGDVDGSIVTGLLPHLKAATQARSSASRRKSWPEQTSRGARC